MKVLVFLLVLLTVVGCDRADDKSSATLDLQKYSGWLLVEPKPVRHQILDKLEEERVPYIKKQVAGKTWIYWKKKYDPKVKKIQTQIYGEPAPEGRSVSFVDVRYYRRLKADLGKIGIRSHIYHQEGPTGGLTYIYWDDKTDTPRVAKVIESYGLKWYTEKEKKQFFQPEEAPPPSIH